MAEYPVDARRLLCPMPVIRLQQAVAECVAGDTLRLVATDPGVESDIPAWCRVHGHTLLSMQEQDERTYVAVIRVE